MKITLCGSTKYRDQFEHWNRELSKQGHIVYNVSSYGHSGDTLTDAEKEMLDLVHLRKIIESEAILVVGIIETPDRRPTYYVGDSTRREIKWARLWGKPVYAIAPHTEHGYMKITPGSTYLNGL